MNRHIEEHLKSFDIEKKSLIFKIIFILSYQGSLILVLFNNNPHIHEANPIMRTILDFNPLGSILLFLLISLGLVLSDVKKKATYCFLVIGSLILLVNFVRELILLF